MLDKNPLLQMEYLLIVFPLKKPSFRIVTEILFLYLHHMEKPTLQLVIVFYREYSNLLDVL